MLATVYEPLNLRESLRVLINRLSYSMIDDEQCTHFLKFRCPTDTTVLKPAKKLDGNTWYLWGQCRECYEFYPISTEPEKLTI